MNILVTGITGRVGANVARHFLQKGHKVRGFVWPGDRQSEKLEQVGAEIVEGNLASSADVNAAARDQEVILHLGAAFQAGGPFTPEQYFDTNVKGTFNILEAALGLGNKLKHVMLTSTDATMSKYPPNGIDEPIREDSLPLDTTDWYGYTKVLDEHLVSRYVRHENLRATVIRFSNVWGAGEVLDFRQFHLKTFLDQFASRSDEEGQRAYAEMKSAYKGEPHLIIACDRHGRPWKKQMIEVREIVHAYDKAVGNPNTFGNVYQLASREPFTWDTVVPYIAEKTGAPVTRVNLPMNPTYYEYDLSAAKKDFGYNPTMSIEEMIDDALRFKQSGSGEIIPTKL
jgi:nucleoside-diphosphate-sugar epimerase